LGAGLSFYEQALGLFSKSPLAVLCGCRRAPRAKAVRFMRSVLSRFSSEPAAQVLPENRLAELMALLDTTKSQSIESVFHRLLWRECPTSRKGALPPCIPQSRRRRLREQEEKRFLPPVPELGD